MSIYKRYKITPEVSRRVIKKLRSDDYGFESWMRNYLSAKEYYRIRQYSLHLYTIDELSTFIIKLFSDCKIKINRKDIELLLQINNRLGLTILIIDSLDSKRLHLSNDINNILLSNILEARIIESKIISGKLNLFNNRGNGNSNYTIVAPVCPDYSYSLKNDGSYFYTFEGVGNGIGLVARKAISNISLIKSLSDDINKSDSLIKYKILIGDFEAHKDNLEALEESEESFLTKISESKNKIMNKCNIETKEFTYICNGLSGWRSQIEYLKYIHNIYSLDDLISSYPSINHEKNLISRIPLYTKWFGQNKDYKKIFFDQCVEYMLMGYLIKNYYGDKSIILASDHKAMRDYYSLITNINLISVSASY